MTTLSPWKDLTRWMYGDARQDEGFWYSHPLEEIQGLSEEQLCWVLNARCLCMLWQVGHIAHRERVHLTHLIQGIPDDIPPPYAVFGTDWCSTAEMRAAIDSVGDVLAWVEEVRQASRAYIASLRDDDFHRVLPDAKGLTVGHWLFITTCHGALHIGKIQLLRAMLEGALDRPC